MQQQRYSGELPAATELWGSTRSLVQAQLSSAVLKLHHRKAAPHYHGHTKTIQEKVPDFAADSDFMKQSKQGVREFLFESWELKGAHHTSIKFWFRFANKQSGLPTTVFILWNRNFQLVALLQKGRDKHYSSLIKSH